MRVYKSKPTFFFKGEGARSVRWSWVHLWTSDSENEIISIANETKKNSDLHSADENEFKYENVPLSNKLKIIMKLLLKNLILEISEGSEVVNVLPQFQSQQEKKWSDDQ